ncbi:MAG: hypothetical protein EBV06_11850 [Planctomycetia bacterium]|nr:hypothetical protein [Planctomycetia bacterium]
MLVEVKGRVYHRGDALPTGTIVFAPDTERGTRGPLAYGQVGPNGEFELSTQGKMGCPPGRYKVTLAISRAYRVPDRYRDPDLSGQRVEVRAGVVNHCDIRLD